MITDTRVEIGADRICTIVPKELNSDKNKTAIKKFVRIILSLKWHHGNCVILRGAKLLTIKHAGVSVILLFKIYLMKQSGEKNIIPSFTNKQQNLRNTDL